MQGGYLQSLLAKTNEYGILPEADPLFSFREAKKARNPPGCPIGWTLMGAACKAPKGFKVKRLSEECQAMFSKNPVALVVNPSDKDKTFLKKKCGMNFPAEDMAPDYNKSCPQGWKLRRDGECHASGYNGPCEKHQDFRFYTNSMKWAWAKSCGVQWPLTPKKAPPPWSQPKVAEEANFSPIDPKHCQHDYSQDCPAGYSQHPKKRTCEALSYQIFPRTWSKTKKQACSVLDPARLTDDMKAAFKYSCQVEWPCKSVKNFL